MEILLALFIGFLFATAVYCLLRRSVVRVIVGIILLSQSANLLVFTAAGLTPGKPGLIPLDAKQLSEPSADPLPQALVLTAIVIGFGLVAFALVLARNAYQAIGHDDLNRFRGTDT
jgi:multicomponent Na+:H+ antiporter subunit C